MLVMKLGGVAEFPMLLGILKLIYYKTQAKMKSFRKHL